MDWESRKRQLATESRQRATRVRKELPDYDRAAYQRGWAADQRGTSIEAGDRRREPDEWYDGYSDSAINRGKWHTPLCANRKCPGALHGDDCEAVSGADNQ